VRAGSVQDVGGAVRGHEEVPQNLKSRECYKMPNITRWKWWVGVAKRAGMSHSGEVVSVERSGRRRAMRLAGSAVLSACFRCVYEMPCQCRWRECHPNWWECCSRYAGSQRGICRP